MLGFVRRVVKPFYDEKVLICLYRTHVSSTLEYCTSIFSPHQDYLCNKIESIQKRAVKWICFKSRTPYSSSNYLSLCEKFGLPPLSARREVTDLRQLVSSNLNPLQMVPINQGCGLVREQMCPLQVSLSSVSASFIPSLLRSSLTFPIQVLNLPLLRVPSIGPKYHK